jgi:hypothetical protein
MLGNTRLLALCTSAALVLSAECNPDSPTVAARARSSIKLGERRRYRGSAIMRNLANVTTPRFGVRQ